MNYGICYNNSFPDKSLSNYKISVKNQLINSWFYTGRGIVLFFAPELVWWKKP